MKTLRHVYTDMCMRTHSPDLCTQASCMCTHARVPETMKNKFFFCIKTKVWNESDIVWELFQTLIFSI